MKNVYRSVTRSAFVILFLMGFVAAYAQQRVVTGRVTDDAGNGMPGVNVIKKSTTIGTSTDGSGNFSIEAVEEDVLVVSFIGYQSQEIRVGSLTRIDVKLIEDVETLSEVVVVGYGTQKKSDLTGAIASLTGESMRGSVTATVDQAMQGRVAGVQVTQNSGQPGGAVSVRIRGTTSLTGSSEPLYVVDGIPISGRAGGITGFDWQGGSGGQQAGALNALGFLNPNDIERIEFLKDASATAIYGSRASNGVVMITTKRGKKGEATLSYNGYYAVQEVYSTFDMMDLPAYATYNNEVAQEVSTINPDPRFADPTLLGPGTDWQEAVFQVAPMQSHNISLTGGSEGTQYMFSVGYFDQEGIIIGSGFERLNARIKVDSKVKKGINLGANVALSITDEKITLQDGGDGVISQAAQMPPHIPVTDFNGEYAGPNQQNVSSQIGSNPVALALQRNNTVTGNRVNANFFADFEIIEGLKFRSELSTDYGNNLNKAFIPTYQWGTLVNAVSQLAQSSSQNFFWQWNNVLTYNKIFGSHAVTVMAGTEAQKSRYEGFTAYKIDLPNDIPVMNQGNISNIQNSGYKGWSSLASYFARANYSFNDKYLLTATIRRDGSSRFGPQKRWGWFPSASFAWRISQEDFLKQSDVISDMKLRFGWGEVGNQEIANYAFGSSLATVPSAFGQAVRNNAYSNPAVQWESTEQTNIGLDLAMFGGRVELTFDAYNKVTDNLLLQVNLPDIYGTQVAGPWANVGSMENRGVEGSLNTINIDKGKFKWTSNFNATINKNKVTDIGGTAIYNNVYWYSGFQTANVTDTGYPVGQFYGFVADGIFTSQEDILNHAVQIPSDNNPNLNKIERTTGVWLGDMKWKDLNNDGVINSSDQRVIGDPNPDWTFGFNNSFTYSNFSLDVFIIGTIGGDILNYSRARNEQMIGNFDNQLTSVQNRAQTRLKEGGTDINNIEHVELINPETTMPRFDNGGENNNHYMSTRWIEDGTYVRIQNVRLGYSLPASLLQKARISRVEFYANIQNLVTFTDYTGLDPQIGVFNQSSLRQNIDMGRYPTPRVYTFGLNVNF